MLEHGWGTAQPKTHHLKLKQTYVGAECHLLPVLCVNLNLPVATHKVQGAESLGSSKGVIDSWEGVGIPACRRIDFARVNAESKGSIVLQHQHTEDAQGLLDG